MAMYLVNSKRVAVEFQRVDAATLSYPELPGCQALSFRTDSLDLMIKELITEFFTIRYNEFRFFRNQAIESSVSKPGLHSRVMLQGDLHYSVPGLGNIHQPEGSASLIWSDAAQCRALFEEDKKYRAFDVFVSPVVASQLSDFFPGLHSELQNKTPASILPMPFFITPPVNHVINEILDCSYDEATSRFYFDLKVREYLYLLLNEKFQLHRSFYKLTPHEVECLKTARKLLLSDLSRPPLTARELARKAGVKELKLKAGFMQLFGVTVFECFQKARMEKARELLLGSNKPIKDICRLTGYRRITNFIIAFRKRFGISPGALRRS